MKIGLHQGSAKAILLWLLGASIVLLPAVIAKAESYAPVQKYAVENWYQGKPQFHRRWFNDIESSFTTDWVWVGRPHAPCKQGSIRVWEYVSSEPYEDDYHLPQAIGEAYYMSVECDGSGQHGPYKYGSATIRHWVCADGIWREPQAYWRQQLCTLAPGQPDPDRNKGPPECPENCFGDPINAGTGNKFEKKVEYQLHDSPVRFEWTYNSRGVSPASSSVGDVLGRLRTTSLSRELSFSVHDSVTTAHLSRPDGSAIRFNKNGDIWTPSYADIGSLAPSGSNGTWLYKLRSGEEEIFDTRGRLTSYTDSLGRRAAIEYTAVGRIGRIIDEKGRAISLAYDDVSGNLATLTGASSELIRFEYNAEQLLTKVTKADGTSVQYLYDEAEYSQAGSGKGALTGVIDENNTRHSSTYYDVVGRATSTSEGGSVNTESATYVDSPSGDYSASATITTAAGATRQVQFEVQKGRVVPVSVATSCAGCVGESSAYNYDANGFLDTIVRNGTTTDYDYSASGLLTQKIDAGNDANGKKRTTQTDWDPNLRVPTERRLYNASNQLVTKSTWAYNSRGQALTQSQTDPLGGSVRTTTTTYCEQGNITAGSCPLLGLVTSVNGPRTDVSDVATYTYRMADEATCASAPATCPYRKGDLWKVTNPLGQVTETLKYDGAGRVLSVKDLNGVVTDLEYHPRGWLTARKVRGTNNTVETDDVITRIAYWPTGLVKQVTQPDGAFTAYSYDAAHRLTQITDNAGNRVTYTLDNAGNRIKEDTKDAAGSLKRTLSRVFNQLGQLQTQADANANPTDFSYDANGNNQAVTDALGRVTQNNYDPLNRLARTLQDVGGIQAETKFQYDALDNLTRVTDPKGVNTAYTYNGLGELTQLTSPDTGTTTYTYDSAGNRKTQTDARGQTSTYSYDALNRLTGIAYATTGLNVGYAYDANQAACASTEKFSKGRLTRMTDASGTTQYCYNRFGRLVRKVQTTNGKAFSLRYAYTLSGQLKTVTYPGGAVVTYFRDGQGRITQVNAKPAGGTTQVLLKQATYHPFGSVAGWNYGNNRSLLRPVNQNYQPTAIYDSAVGGLSIGLAYDPVGNLTHLTSATNPVPLISFGYDALSRLTQTKDGPTQTAIETYAYDATGNRRSLVNAGGTQTYTYPTTSHRLMQVGAVARTYDAAGNTTAIGGAAKAFVYDDSGRLSQVSAGGVAAMNYQYNGKGEQVRKYLGTANTYTLYDEAGHWLGDYNEAGAPIQQAIWLDDLPVGLIANNQLHYVEPDHLGTPRVVIDRIRNVPVWKWDLKGEAFGSSPPDQDPDLDGTAFVLDMRFPGQRYDAASGLNYNYFRDYDTTVGRYVESDPIGLRGDIATYSYAANKPLMFYDADGLEPIAAGSCGGGAGMVTCDGKGGYEKRVCSTACTARCTSAHEDQHLSDFRSKFPSKCRGKRRGESPWQKQDMDPDGSYPLDWYELECRADRVGRKCAEDLLAGRSNVCVGPECESTIRRYINAIDQRTGIYKCKEYGW